MYDDFILMHQGRGRIKFSHTEKMHIFIAVSVLTIAFTIMFSPVAIALVDNIWLGAGYSLLISALAVITGFLFHELAHKFMAQRYGAWAEFRMYPLGLILALIFSFAGFIFAAPGAVYIQGLISRSQNAKISLSGPTMNLIVGAVFILAWAVLPVGNILGLGLRIVGLVNLFLAVFNLLPIPPMDGSKIFGWNPILYVCIFGTSLVLLLFAWGII